MMTSDKPVMLSMSDVSLSYQSKKTSFDGGVHKILNSVSLQLYEGETLGIIGRNGSGKSTILRLMAGILAPNSGTVTLREGATAALLTLGLGFRSTLSGRDNALLSAMLQGASRRQAQAFLEDIKSFSELGDSFEEPVKTYSSGMRARLGFSTALLTHVDILLIDEVLSVGDAHFRKKAEDALKQRITGRQTVVFVSHADAQIRALCDRAVWLNNAEIAAQGDTADVLKQYRGHIKELNARQG